MSKWDNLLPVLIHTQIEFKLETRLSSTLDLRDVEKLFLLFSDQDDS